VSVTLELIDIFVIIGICQGIFLSAAIMRINNTNKKANSILSALILICTFMLIGRVLMLRFFSEWIFQWTIVFDVVLFLFGPLFYLYVRRLLIKDERTEALSFYHFIPALVFAMVALVYVILYSPMEYWEAYKQGALTLMFHVWIVAGILSNTVYLLLSFRLVRTFRKAEKETFSFEQNPIQFLTYFLYTIAFIIVVWGVSYVNSMWLDRYIVYIGYDMIWITIPVFIYIIGYYSLKQPELFRISLDKENSNNKDRLSHGEAKLLKDKLDSLMENERVYLQNDLTLRDVAEKLHTSTNNLSWVLNNSYSITFYDFINGYRIREFVQKIEKKEHLQHTILALSMDVGFNSKSTFNKAFKQNMNETPSTFIKKQSAA
jgi:AraC-like DNA-binding protein